MADAGSVVTSCISSSSSRVATVGGRIGSSTSAHATESCPSSSRAASTRRWLRLSTARIVCPSPTTLVPTGNRQFCRGPERRGCRHKLESVDVDRLAQMGILGVVQHALPGFLDICVRPSTLALCLHPPHRHALLNACHVRPRLSSCLLTTLSLHCAARRPDSPLSLSEMAY